MKTLKLSYFEKLSENYGKNVGDKNYRYDIDNKINKMLNKISVNEGITRNELSRDSLNKDEKRKIKLYEERNEVYDRLFKYCGTKWYCPNARFVNSKRYIENLDNNFTNIQDVKFEYIEDKINILLQYILFSFHLISYIKVGYAPEDIVTDLYFVAKLEKPIVISYLINNVLYNLKIDYLLKININIWYFITENHEFQYFETEKDVISNITTNNVIYPKYEDFGKQFNLEEITNIIKRKKIYKDSYKNYIKKISESEYINYNTDLTGIEKYRRF
uniref:Uncharacterized protein n=1 Tax=Pithovirus LCDPAC02 TaxID=2506601 RepID=A0A481YPX3_9VIRU|nr:MAG: hypothetical protein LCDPAC02_01760 [Pithovirus LCDPAC02]